MKQKKTLTNNNTNDEVIARLVEEIKQIEHSILYTLLNYDDKHEIINDLSEEDFYSLNLKRYFTATKYLFNSNAEINAITVTNALKELSLYRKDDLQKLIALQTTTTAIAGKETVRILKKNIKKLKAFYDSLKKQKEILEKIEYDEDIDDAETESENKIADTLDRTTFLIRNNFVYLFRASKNGAKIEMVGPALNFTSKIVDGKTVTYEVSYKERKDILREIDDFETIRKITGKSIISKANYQKWLNIVTENLPVKKVIRTTGWHDDIFCHPCLNYENIFFSENHILVKRKKAYLKDTEKQHEFVKKALKEGRLLGVLYLAAASNVILEKINANPFVFILTGLSSEGKTLSCSLACNLFYENPLLTTNTTQVGAELSMKELKDLPLLLDEGALKIGLDLEKLVFMVAAKLGKVRGTKNLSIDFTTLNSNIFYNSETLDIDEFKRTGAFRRMIYVSIYSWNDISEVITLDDAKKALKYIGAGVDYIKFINENKDIFSEISEFAEQYVSVFPDMEQVTKGLFAGVKFLEKFYNEDFTELFNYLMILIEKTKTEFEEKKDVVSMFLDKFSQFVATNHFKFARKYVEEKDLNRNEILGKIENNEVFVLTSVFTDFCKNNGWEKKVLLKLLMQKGILIPGSNGLRKMKRIFDGGVPVATYHFVLKAPDIIETPEDVETVEVAEPF